MNLPQAAAIEIMYLYSKLLQSDCTVILNPTEDRYILFLLLKKRIHHRKKATISVNHHNAKCTG